MNPTSSSPPTTEFDHLPPEIRDLRQILREQPLAGRIRRVEVDGRQYWVKQQEKLSLRWRLQKGNPVRAFERDRQALHRLHAMGLPVAAIVDEGADYFVTRASGVDLAALSALPDVSQTEKEAALAAGVAALQALHAAGVAHGRPHLKDMLWDGASITLIDFERFGMIANPGRAQVIDFIVFAFSCFAVGNYTGLQIDDALQRYRLLDRQGVFDRAICWLNRLRWLGPMARGVLRMRNSRELAATLPLFDWARDVGQRSKPSG